MKALVIKISDAGVFQDPRISKTKDIVADAGNFRHRAWPATKTYEPYIQVPSGSLCVRHVANLLRVLWGERPIPSLREIKPMLAAEKNPYFEELARKSRVIISTVVLPSDGKFHKTPYYPQETKTVRKATHNSWQTAKRNYFLDGKFIEIQGGLLYNDRLHRMLGNELFMKFHETAKLFGSYETVQQAIELLNRHKLDERVRAFCVSCSAEGRKSLSNMILNDNPKSVSINTAKSGRQVLNVLMAIGSIQSIEKFNAVIYVPVTEEDLSRIDAGSGVASFLEGGYARVDHVEDWSELIEVGSTIPVEGNYVCD